MKTLILILLTAASALAQQNTSCVTLTYRDSTLCTFDDGTGVITDYDRNGGFTDSDFNNPETWHALRTKLVQEDTAKVQARTAQLKAVQEQTEKDAAGFEAHHALVMRSMSITRKKDCLSAGFAWSRGICSLKEGQ